MLSTVSVLRLWIISLICVHYGASDGTKDRSKKGCDHLKACLDHFPMFVDFIEHDKSRALATLSYDTLINFVCSKKSKLNNCVARTSCQTTKKLTASIVNEMVQYICNGGRNVLMSESGCFSRDAFEWGTYQCSSAMKLEIEIITLQIKTLNESHDKFCKVFDNLLKCIHANVERSCSTKAANFVRFLYGLTVKPLAASINCAKILEGLLKS
ncbi:uncharacterized protein LOC131929681 [Physella acuta]|uniref:uncharacterized protein LOC131929681 n=1 Tax=Physella acuta TaxID=109671 RepID=UPI0027DDFB45|nr:uncharacterized protein LOC131929681 [Physella acuta]XP_059141986.1 uncharacterized protein LOC131929681 [Physella acuta]XP_059141987.1 uncharacterized protein LOC131929681 [Physella acuta]XP_059141988.1 uncharacterized protein LOC131929681 [Physella acuta]